MQKDKLLAYIALACVCFFWGTTYLVIRIGVQTFPPLLLAGFRHSLGGLLLCSYFFARGYRIPPWKELRIIVLTGMMTLVMANGLVTWAEKYIPSGPAALICATVPFWIIGLTLFSGKSERLNGSIILGIVLGMTGQVLIFADSLKDFVNPIYLWGMLAIFIGTFGWASGTVYSKHHPLSIHPLFGAGLQMLAAGLVLDIIGFAAGEGTHLNLQWSGLLALLYLVSFGSIVAYGSYMYALSKLPATLVSIYAYINPLVAVLLGWIILSERLSLNIILAIVLTLGGVYLVNRGFRPKEQDIPNA